MANLDQRIHFNSTRQNTHKDDKGLSRKKDKRMQYLCKKHDQFCQLLIRFIRLKFENLYIGLVMSVLL